MVNLLMTMRCNRSCNYCFAREKLRSYSDADRPMDITSEDLEKVLSFLEKSGCNYIQLAGGEPTIHSKFDEMLKNILQRGIYVNLLSNALWKREKNELFSKISPTKLGFLLNVDHPGTYRPDDWERIEENLSALHGRGNVTMSFNIFEMNPKCEYIFDLVSRHGFTNLRLSFSMPVVFGDSKNSYMPIEDYRNLAPFVMHFVEKAEELGATVKMDNTVPICMFSNEQLGALLLKGVLDQRRNFVCFPAVDIGPDLSIWRCFGTSGLFNKRLDDFGSLEEIYDYYERVFKPYQFEVFPLDECGDCGYAKDGMCQGGCIGFSAAKCLRSGNMPREVTDEELLGSKPMLSRHAVVKRYEIPEETLVLVLRNRDIMDVPPSMDYLLGLLNGKRTLREAALMYIQKATELSGSEDPLEGFLTDVAVEKLMPTIRKLLDKKFLILKERG